ncbi:amino acid adenylation domain-containing protein [Krasilnikovia cinnamomea]|uniref:Amino acid adenylation domain-containing protein n=1 Tax=Krasilnikovia cinnamomea TaxID=349313 RepID=A0A4Q7ZKR8_9ACTN|nr:AMP-binding protein [Krasilnikovia cinnamomea]RZU50933.1 amino acid adenylation domain-containing protein [Krasilnikovia cinnamomea]
MTTTTAARLSEIDGLMASARFAIVADEFPAETAIDTGSETVSYFEFRDAVSAAASVLADLKIARQGRIGLVADKRPSTYEYYLGSWHGAHAVVPLGPQNPTAFNADICRRAGLDAVVVDPTLHPELAATLRHDGIAVVDPNQPAPGAAGPAEPLLPGDIAYILFTSGSTGRPKGVPVSHGNVRAYLNMALPASELGPGARLSHTFALTFDPSVHDMLAAWTTGSTLVVPRNRELLAPSAYVSRRGITHWYSVPSLAAYARRSGTLGADSMPALRQSLFIGEPLPLELARDWAAAAPGSIVRNVYGPTELTISCVEYQLPADVTDWPETSNGTAPIGAVYPDLEWVLVDGDRTSSTQGELCVRGSMRFPGYLSPADNADRFLTIADGTATRVAPGDPVPADHWYRTGDLVRVAAEGLLHLGRLDRQVKISGHRIELGEVEWKLSTHPDVLDAAVLALPDGNGGLQLRAAATGTAREYAEIKQYLLGLMPAYMLPAAVTWLPSFPVNGSGKVDYLALRDMLVTA